MVGNIWTTIWRTSGAATAGAGLIEVTNYYTTTTADETTAGCVVGYVASTQLMHGYADANPVTLTSTTYLAHNPGWGTPVVVEASTTEYAAVAEQQPRTTNYSYTWYPDSAQMASRTLVRPAVAPAQNGSGQSDTETTFYDLWGLERYTKDGSGCINYSEYDSVTGAMTLSVIDADTTTTMVDTLAPASVGTAVTYSFTVQSNSQTVTASYPANTSDTATDIVAALILAWNTANHDGETLRTHVVASGTDTLVLTVDQYGDTFQLSSLSHVSRGLATPAGTRLGLTTSRTVDWLGRITSETDPNGNVTYYRYSDSQTEHATLIFPGWHETSSGHYGTTGPVQEMREDRSQQYTEQATFAYPGITNTEPSTGDTLGDLLSLSRSLINTCGQVTQSRSYYNFDDISGYSTDLDLGTTANYYVTAFSYDALGRQNRVLSPTGTLSRVVFDDQSRVASTWVGTDDTPTDGTWSPSNTSGTNLVKVSENQYDNGGIGDGNLTATTTFPNGTTGERSTLYFYDWRDRLVATESGINPTASAISTDDNTHPITFNVFDNIGEVAETRSYDGEATLSVANASFETPVLASGTSQTGPSNAGWSFYGNSGITHRSMGGIRWGLRLWSRIALAGTVSKDGSLCMVSLGML